MRTNQSDLNSLREFLEQLPPFVFLGGIHGVGKSTLCDSTFGPAGYHCVTASSLIRLYKMHSDHGKLVDDIPDNQSALIKQLQTEKGARSHLLLDGHFCLLNREGVVEPIELEVFKEMSPSALVLVKCDPEVVATRLINRDDKDWSPEMLGNFQDKEEAHAERIAEALGISLTIIISEIRN